jgi:hypothetical protein
MRIDSLFYRLAYRSGRPRWDSTDPRPERGAATGSVPVNGTGEPRLVRVKENYGGRGGRRPGRYSGLRAALRLMAWPASKHASLMPMTRS